MAKLQLGPVDELTPGPGRGFQRTLVSFRNPDITDDVTVLYVDAIVNLGHELTTEYTQYAIEDGSPFSDHAVNAPEKLSVTIVQTQTPILWGRDGFEARTLSLDVPQSRFRPGGMLAVSMAAEQAIRGLVGAVQPEARKLELQVLQGDGDVDRIDVLYSQIYAAWQGNFPFTVTCRGRSYVDYMLTRVGYNIGGPAEYVEIPLELTRIRTTTLQETSLPDPVSFRNSEIDPGGKTPPKPKEVYKKRAHLARIEDEVRGLR